ncbi:MAG: hypothetical protein PUE72_07745 [Lachnospiraceae bacterium]|nr:hypothetical protein [Lachnospiraceae bacterium]
MGETTVKDSSAKKNRRLQRRNRELEEQQKRTNTYYKNLLDMESCGILAYTLPEYKIQHMNTDWQEPLILNSGIGI